MNVKNINFDKILLINFDEKSEAFGTLKINIF